MRLIYDELHMERRKLGAPGLDSAPGSSVPTPPQAAQSTSSSTSTSSSSATTATASAQQTTPVENIHVRSCPLLVSLVVLKLVMDIKLVILVNNLNRVDSETVYDSF